MKIIKFYDRDKLLVRADIVNNRFFEQVDKYTVFTGKLVPILYKDGRIAKYDRVEVINVR